MRRDLVERALDLARMLRALLPDDADVAGLLALMLLTDARRGDPDRRDGRLVLLADQDRSRWDRAEIAEGVALVREALRRARRAGTPCRRRSPRCTPRRRAGTDTDWARDRRAVRTCCCSMWPSPVVALNRAVAVGSAPTARQAGLAALDALAGEPQLAAYGYLRAARADFLRRLGRVDEARTGVRGGAAADRERGRAPLPPAPTHRAQLGLRGTSWTR